MPPPRCNPVAHCTQCGAALVQGARYCASCGSLVVQPTLPPPERLFQPGGVEPPKRKDTGGAETLILIGAILSAVLGLLFGLLILFFGAFFGLAIGDAGAGFPGFLFGLFGLGIIVLGILFAAGGLYARNLVRAGEVERGGLLAIVFGALCLFTGDFIAGIVMAAGGVLAYTAR